MINFKQEIEHRLALYQHLNGKGNVKDCNRTLYEILRLMLGMIISQDDDNPTMMPPFTPGAAPDASPSREAPNGYQIYSPASTPLPQPPFTHTSEEEDDNNDEAISITPETLALSAAPQPINPHPEAPYGYTRAGHVRLTPLPYGLTATGRPRKPPLRK